VSKNTRSLGRGLGALLPNQPIYQQEITDNQHDIVKHIKTTDIIPNANQPRREFDKEKLQELCESIKEHGVIQPIIVVPHGIKYMIVAGERRFRASQMAELEEMPCIIRELSDSKVLELALIENIQREDLMPLEEATALHTLTEQLEVSKTDLAKRLGKSRSYVSNMIRLLTLPREVQTYLTEGKISYGHARALLSLDEPLDMINLAQDTVKKNMSVRQVEKAVHMIHDTKKKETPIKELSQDEKLRELIIKDMEEKIKSHLKTQITIKDEINKGRIIIDYFNDQELERLVNEICK